MTLINISIKGGPGSGNWGHRGIPGKVGGSSPRGVGGFVAGTPAYGKLGDVDKKANDMLLNVARGGYNDNDLQRLVDDGKRAIIQMQGMEASAYVLANYERGVQVNQSMLDSNSHWAMTTDEHKGVVKSNIISKLSDRTGISRMDVNSVMGKWAHTSNDMSREAISLQEAVTEEFDTKLSNWQEGNRMRSKGFMGREDERKLLRAMYNDTQTELRKAGYKTGDTITLYRGYIGDADTPVPDRATNTNYKGNAMESWSVLAGIAHDFGRDVTHGRVLAMKVPIENIISTAATGLGCLSEGEFVILGSGKDNVAHVMSLEDLGL